MWNLINKCGTTSWWMLFYDEDLDFLLYFYDETRMELSASPDYFSEKQRITRHYGASYGNSDGESRVEENDEDTEGLYRTRLRRIEIGRKQ